MLRDADRRRVETVQQQVESQLQEKDKAVQAERDEFEKKRKEYLAMVDELEGELKSLEQQNADLKRQLGAHSGRRLGARTGGAGVSTGDASSADLRAARLEIDLLQQALSHAKLDAARLQAAAMRETLAELPPLAGIRQVVGPLREAPKAIKEANDVIRQLLVRSAAVQLVNLEVKKAEPVAEPPTPMTPATPHVSAPKTPAHQLAAAVADMEALRQKTNQVRGQLRPLLARATGQPESYFGDSVAGDYARLAKARSDPPLVGKVTLPAPIHAHGNAVHVGFPELKALHAALLA